MIAINDIVQITDETHPWFPALLVVSEVKTWGVQAYAIIPERNDQPHSTAQAYNRLKAGTYEKVGAAVIVDREDEA